MNRQRGLINLVIVSLVLAGVLWALNERLPGRGSSDQSGEGLGAIPSLYDESQEFKPAEPVFIAEINWLLETLKLAQAKGWAGGEEKIPVTLADYEPELIARYVARVGEQRLGLRLPVHLKPFYTSPEAQAEMRELIRQFRQEYLEYAAWRGVSRVYLLEIEEYTLPDQPGRLFYYPNERYPDNQNSNVHTYPGFGPGNYRGLQMNIYAANVYKVALEIEAAGILGPWPEEVEKQRAYWQASREMALRYVVYHEMTHVLQQAVNVTNAAADARSKLLPWLYAHRNILHIDNRHYQSWGNQTDKLSREINNMEIAKESQAEGVAIQMVGEVYNLAVGQRQLLWEHHFGSLSQGRTEVNEVFRLMEEAYPATHPGRLAHQLRELIAEMFPGNTGGETRQALSELQQRLDGYMAAHLGYLNPMTEEETERFWDFLQQ
jgi:hypothetical protein